MLNWLEKIMQGWIGRLVRTTLATGAAAWWAHHTGDHWVITVQTALGAGVFTAVGKYLRDKAPGAFEWLPF